MKIWVGDETGLLKSLNIDQKVINKYRSQDRQRGIVSMCWAGTKDNKEDLIALGLVNGCVELFDTKSISISRIFDPAPLLESPTTSSSLTAAEQAKSLRIPKHFENKDVPLHIALSGLDVVDSSLITCTKSGVVTIRPIDINAGESPTLQFVAATHCEKMSVSHESQGRFLCTGGKESDVKIWDVTNPAEPIFKGKNLPHDNTDLRQPIWITDLSFVPHTDDKQVIVGTAYHQIRLYDTRVKKRPIFNIEVGEYGVNTLSCTPDGRVVMVGDKGGYLSSYDLRTHLPHGRYKNCAGSIRSIQCHPTLPLVASCGIDRFVRVYNTESREMVNKFFCKQRMTSLLFSKEEYIKQEKEDPKVNANESKASTNDNSERNEDDEDDVWNQLEVTDTKLKQKKKSKSVKRKASEQEDQEEKELRESKEQEEKAQEAVAADEEPSEQAEAKPRKSTKKVRSSSSANEKSENGDNDDSDNESKVSSKTKSIKKTTKKKN